MSGQSLSRTSQNVCPSFAMATTVSDGTRRQCRVDTPPIFTDAQSDVFTRVQCEMMSPCLTWIIDGHIQKGLSRIVACCHVSHFGAQWSSYSFACFLSGSMNLKVICLSRVWTDTPSPNIIVHLDTLKPFAGRC